MSTSLRSIGSSALAALALLAAPAAAGVIRIAGQPGLGAFTSLQAAIDAAADGELLLVQSGSYGAATIDGKSLSIVEMPGAAAIAAGSLTIKNLGATQRALVVGLEIKAASGTGLILANDAGHVRLQGCKITGGRVYGPNGPDGAPGMQATACSRIVLTGCTVIGGSPDYNPGELPTPGGPGVSSVNSSIALYDCTIWGGTGSGETTPGGHGGNGCEVTSFGIVASGTAIIGGAGGGGDYIGCNAGGDAGDALVLTNAQAHMLDSPLTAGVGGWGSCGVTGNPGQTLVNSGGIFDQLAGSRRKLTSAALVSDNATLAITLSGQSGDRFYLLRSRLPGYLFQKSMNGVWTLPLPAFAQLVPLGVVPPSGTLALSIPTSDLPPTKPHELVYFQGYCLDASNKGFLTSPLQVEHFDRAGGTDCDGNGTNDFVDLIESSASDCNRNIAPDTCDIASGLEHDCNANGTLDSCELAAHTTPDCNGNGVPDSCDIASGTASDCNANGRPDSCDIALGASLDVNHNGIPDECEPHTPVTIWVDASAPAGGNGSQSSPFQSIQEGITASFHGDTVMVRDGTYTGPSNRNLDPNGQAMVIRSEHGAAACIIDCQGAGRGFRFDSHEGPTTKLQGFTIRNGVAATSGLSASHAGGIYVYSASPIIEDCVIENCTARLGAGISASVTSMQLRRCTIRNCQAVSLPLYDSLGGGLYFSSAMPGALPAAIVDTEISGCTADFGAGLHLGSTDRLVVSHCRIFGNAAVMKGGGIKASAYNSAAVVLLMENCLVAGNTAPTGAGIALDAVNTYPLAPSWSFVDCTIVDNAATTAGGGVQLTGSYVPIAPVELHDTVLWGNTAPSGATLFHSGGAVTIRVFACDVEGGQASFDLDPTATLIWGSNNIAADPQFVDRDGPDNNLSTFGDNDYRLALVSPCIDAGDNALVPPDFVDIDADGDVVEPVPYDLDHVRRFIDVPGVPNTGQGIPPLVDIGAYERTP